LVKTEVGKIIGVPYLNCITYDSNRATNYGRLWYGILCILLFLNLVSYIKECVPKLKNIFYFHSNTNK